MMKKKNLFHLLKKIKKNKTFIQWNLKKSKWKSKKIIKTKIIKILI